MIDLFRKYQQDLLKLANHSLGRRYLGINSKEKITGLAPNAWATKNGKKTRVTFRTYPVYQNKLGMALQEYDSLLEGLKYYFKPRDLVWIEMQMATGGPYYPTAGAGDGTLHQTGNASWSGTREDGTSDTKVHGAPDNVGINTGYILDRLFLPFDTDDIGAGQEVEGPTTMSIASGGVNSDTQGLTLGLTTSTQADPDALATTDFDALTLNTPTELATRLVVNDMSDVAGGYDDWVMNADGYAAVEMEGWTKLVLRFSKDIDDSAPTAGTYYFCNTSAYAGTTRDPKLVVTYSAVTTAAGNFLPLL